MTMFTQNQITLHLGMFATMLLVLSITSCGGAAAAGTTPIDGLVAEFYEFNA